MATTPEVSISTAAPAAAQAPAAADQGDHKAQPLHTQEAQTVAEMLGVDPARGLSAAESAERLKIHGPNQLADAKKASPLVLFLRQFVNPLLIILMVGAVISGYTGHWVDAIAILVIVLINAGISFTQEWKAERSLAALGEMAAPKAQVLRDADWQDIPARDIVPGDVLRIKAGDILAADVRLIEANRLQIDEAALTGESEPVDKHHQPSRATATWCSPSASTWASAAPWSPTAPASGWSPPPAWTPRSATSPV
jgi:magnesium-transporting ATPase (P-type)